MILEFRVEKQSLNRIDNQVVIEKSNDYLRAHFDFTSDWQDTIKSVYFSRDKNIWYIAELNLNNECYVPREVIYAQGFNLYLIGRKEAQEITTNIKQVVVGITGNGVGQIPSITEIVSNNLDVLRDVNRVEINIPSDYLDEVKKESGNKVNITIDPKTYIMNFKLLNIYNEVLSTQNVDLPIESLLADIRYDEISKCIILVKDSGEEIRIPLDSLIKGLVSETTFNNAIETINTEITTLKNNKVDNSTFNEFKENIDNDILGINSEIDTLTEITSNTQNELTSYKEYNDNIVSTKLPTETFNSFKLTNDEILNKLGATINLNLDNSTFIMTIDLVNKEGQIISTKNIDFPLESVVVNASYSNKILSIILQNGNTINVPIGDLVEGLVSQSDFDIVKNKVANLEENKVDKVEGKGLSTNDYTTAEKDKLENLHNYDDTELKEKTEDLDYRVNLLEGQVFYEIESEDTFITRQTCEGANIVDNSMAQIECIGGNSEVSENLLVLEDKAPTTINGITYSIKNGVITLNGTSTSATNISLFDISNASELPLIIDLFNKCFTSGTSQGTINFTLGAQGDGYKNRLLQIANGVISKDNGLLNNDLEFTTLILRLSNDFVANNLIIKPMLVKGTTAPTEFKQGYKGIRNATPNKLVSKDKNSENVDELQIPLYSELKSAGKVRDYYYPNGNLVRNVGVRDYVEGDENNPNYLTDMTKTNYPLSTPQISQAQIWEDKIKVSTNGTETFEGTDTATYLKAKYIGSNFNKGSVIDNDN